MHVHSGGRVIITHMKTKAPIQEKKTKVKETRLKLEQDAMARITMIEVRKIVWEEKSMT